MPRIPRLTAVEAEAMLIAAGFALARSKGSHRIYIREHSRIIVPFHTTKTLHPKIVKQVIRAIETT